MSPTHKKPPTQVKKTVANRTQQATRAKRPINRPDAKVRTGQVVFVSGKFPPPTGTRFKQKAISIYPATEERIRSLTDGENESVIFNFLLNFAIDQLAKNPRVINCPPYFQKLSDEFEKSQR